MPRPAVFLLVIVLFAVSGCVALIYEVIWFQQLELVIGVSALSAAVLVAAFMGGMCLGSLLAPRLSPRANPLLTFALLELAVGASGIGLLYALPLVNRFYEVAGTGGLLWRAGVAGLCLLPPSIFMGATLPVISRLADGTTTGAAWIGRVYAANVAGAALGSVVAAFYLLNVWDVSVATAVAAAGNVVVAAAAIACRRAVPPADPPAPPSRAVVRLPVLPQVAVACSGFVALGAQVLWTRLLALLLGASVYAFALILAAYLLGLAVGSAAGAVVARRRAEPTLLLGWTLCLQAPAMWWAATRLMQTYPLWPISPQLAGDVPSIGLELDFVRCLWALLPATALWGAAFPLALAASNVSERGRATGRLYATNTAGAVLGAIVVGVVLVVEVGTQASTRLLIAVSTAAGLLTLVVAARTARVDYRASAAVAAGLALCCGLAFRHVPPLPSLLVQYGRFSAFTRAYAPTPVYVREGLNGPLAVSQNQKGFRYYHNAGKAQASTEPQDMRLQRMLGHLTHLVAREPSHVLVIGLGTGITAGAIADSPLVSRITIVELEQGVVDIAGQFFADENHGVVSNPKVSIRIDDGRHFLHTSTPRYDAVTIDPFDPYARGSALLFTREFFALVKARLNPGGVVTMWLPLYENSHEAAKTAVATFLDSFPNGSVWGNTINGQGYDLVLVGRTTPEPIDVDFLQVKLDNPRFRVVRQSLKDVGFRDALDLLSTYAGSQSDLAPWTSNAAINLDGNRTLQYLAGLGLNRFESAAIYAGMARHAQAPPQLFTGSPAVLDALRTRIEAALELARQGGADPDGKS